MFQETTPLWPQKIAIVYPDGTQGPWIDYVPPATGVAGGDFAPIWDSYELNPRFWNTGDNVPHEFYDLPPGSGNYCFGKGFPNRLYWCDPKQPGCEYLPSCVTANGGDLAANAPDQATVLSFLWGILGNGKQLQVEIQLYDTYDGTGCSNPGSNLVSGLVAHFIPVPAGNYRITLDLVRHGLELDIPDTGRVGIWMTMWEDRDKGIHSDQAWPLIWPTKTDWHDVMGLDDLLGFSDAHGNNNCVLEGGNECVEGEVVCPNGDNVVGPALLLLGEAEPGACIYRLKKNSKPKKGCQSCPKKGDLHESELECSDKFDCPMKFKVKKIECPGGGPGFCKKLKGKRDRCGQLP